MNLITKFTNMLEQKYKETIVLVDAIPTVESVKKWDDFLEKHNAKSWPETGKIAITLRRILNKNDQLFSPHIRANHNKICTTYWFHKDFVEKAVILGSLP